MALVACFKQNKQANKQTNKQTSKQTNKQTNKQKKKLACCLLCLLFVSQGAALAMPGFPAGALARVCLFVGSFGWLVGRLFGWLFDYSLFCLFRWLVGWLVGCFAGLLFLLR